MTTQKEKSVIKLMEMAKQQGKTETIKQVMEIIEFYENYSDFHCPEELKSKLGELAK